MSIDDKLEKMRSSINTACEEIYKKVEIKIFEPININISIHDIYETNFFESLEREVKAPVGLSETSIILKISPDLISNRLILYDNESFMLFSLIRQIFKSIEERLNIESELIALRRNFINDLEADSLNLIELSVDLEEKYNVVLSDDDADKMNTVEDVLIYFAALLN